MREEWRPVVGYEGLYEVSDLGCTRALDRMVARPGQKAFFRPGRMLKTKVQLSGHLGVTLCKGGIKDRQRVHVLVAAAFIGPRPAGLEVRHLDGVHSNNAASNLAYGTSSENRFDAYRHGARPVGQASHLAKISDEQAKELMAMRGKVSSRIAAQSFGLNDSYVRQLWRGESRRYPSA